MCNGVRAEAIMKQIDTIKFVDDATGCGVSLSVYLRDDAMVLMDVQLSDKPATIVSLPCDIAKRLADAIVRAIP
jgi:hypothetical protein